jgi:hypothetical protein
LTANKFSNFYKNHSCTNKITANCADQQHLCAFAKICKNVDTTTPTDPAEIHATNIKNRLKIKQMNQSMPPAPKFKTFVLNQLNPNLTPEQKLTIKLNDVEKWLLEMHRMHRIPPQSHRPFDSFTFTITFNASMKTSELF